MNIVVLAAGGGTRLGGPKALAVHGSADERPKTFLEVIVGGLPAAEVHVVVGAAAERVMERHSALDVRWIQNPEWASTDMMHSLLLGLKACDPEDATLIWPVDCPHEDSRLVHALVQRLASKVWPAAVVPYHDSMPGHPVALSRGACKELVSGRFPTLRAWLEARSAAIVRLDWENPRVLLNINTPSDRPV